MIFSPETFRDVPKVENNYESYKANNDSGDDKGVSGGAVGDIGDGPERLQILQHIVASKILVG